MRGTGELLLYLDFDGVLHHENVQWHPQVGPYISCAPDGYVLFQHAELLEQVLAPYPRVKLVLSTTWARRFGRAYAVKQLRPSLRERVIGATIHSRMSEQNFVDKPRGMQVWNDVVKRSPRDWLALDDDELGWPAWCLEKLVKTNALEGISEPNVLAEFQKKLGSMCHG